MPRRSTLSPPACTHCDQTSSRLSISFLQGTGREGAGEWWGVLLWVLTMMPRLVDIVKPLLGGSYIPTRILWLFMFGMSIQSLTVALSVMSSALPANEARDTFAKSASWLALIRADVEQGPRSFYLASLAAFAWTGFVGSLVAGSVVFK